MELSKEDMLRKAQEEEAELEKEENDSQSDAESDAESDTQSDAQSEESEGERQEVPDEVRRQRWFSDPMFAELEKAESEDDEEAIKAMKEKQRKSMKRELPLEERLRAYSGA